MAVRATTHRAAATPPVRHQGRHGLRRRRARRPVVQRLCGGGSRPGRRRVRRRDLQESEAEDGEAETAREERLRTFADAGYDPIIAVGFAYAASLGKVAAEYPDVHFAIIDDSSLDRRPNVASLVFAEEQGSFLVGAAAALKTESGNIGFVGGVEMPLIQKFEAGYKAGAKAVNPDIKVDVDVPDPVAGLLRLR